MPIAELVTTAAEHDHQSFDWGEITWLDSHELTGTDSLTVGQVTINAGEKNAEHFHPNCDESLYLLAGEIEHTIGEERATLSEGDLIHIPQGEPHRAVNTGAEDAVAVIVYDTGRRQIEFTED